jgi:hypothetical protein
VARAKANPSLLAYRLQSNSYKYSWALIPISIPLVWLLFLHRAATAAIPPLRACGVRHLFDRLHEPGGDRLHLAQAAWA